MRPLVGALLGLAASSVFGVACGSFSSTGTSSEADASVADASNDGSAGRDGDAPQDGAVLTDGGPPDGRTSDADSGESLDAGPADPLTLVGPGKACTAESAFSKAYVLSGFGLNVVSLSMDDEELRAVVVNGAVGIFGNPVTFYQRSSRSNSFAKVSFTRLGNVLAMKTTSVSLSPNGGSLIFALEGEKAGIGKVALDWPLLTSGPASAIFASLAGHFDHPQFTGTGAYVTLRSTPNADGVVARLDTDTQTVNAVQTNGANESAALAYDETELFSLNTTTSGKLELAHATSSSSGASWTFRSTAMLMASVGGAANQRPLWRSADGCRLVVVDVGTKQVRLLDRR
jgi:hypothetical protein